jgi:hypothetical protein
MAKRVFWYFYHVYIFHYNLFELGASPSSTNKNNNKKEKVCTHPSVACVAFSGGQKDPTIVSSEASSDNATVSSLFFFKFVLSQPKFRVVLFIFLIVVLFFFIGFSLF